MEIARGATKEIVRRPTWKFGVVGITISRKCYVRRTHLPRERKRVGANAGHAKREGDIVENQREIESVTRLAFAPSKGRTPPQFVRIRPCRPFAAKRRTMLKLDHGCALMAPFDERAKTPALLQQESLQDYFRPTQG